MDRQHVTRRIVLGAALVALAVLGLGPVHGTLAAPIGEGSKTTFEQGCKDMGGVFIDSPQDGLTACFYDDGSKHVCDSNGSHCTYYPPPPKKLVDSGVDVADAPLIADDTQTVLPADAPLETIAESGIAAPVDSQAVMAAEPSAPAAEPVAAEISAERP